jgi:hypothetical protein
VDKSEGTDFFSKMMDSVGEKLSKWYYTSQKRVTLSALKKMRNEKVKELGVKVLQLLKTKTHIYSGELNSELSALARIEEEIENINAELQGIVSKKVEIQAAAVAAEPVNQPEIKKKRGRKPKNFVETITPAKPKRGRKPKSAASSTSASLAAKPKRKYTKKIKPATQESEQGYNAEESPSETPPTE